MVFVFIRYKKVEHCVENNDELLFSFVNVKSVFLLFWLYYSSIHEQHCPFSRSNNPILLSEPYCEQALCRKISNNICLGSMQRRS